MIGPKVPKLTAKQERDAYRIVTERDRGRCQRCGYYDPDAMQRDHRQGRDAYNTVPSNLQLLGGPGACNCHQWVTEHPGEAVEQGFTVPRWARPEMWPAMRVDDGWVLYDDEGGWREITESTAHLLMSGGME